MKLFIGLVFVASLALTGVFSLPAGSPNDDAEVIGYPRRVSTRTEANNDDDFKDFEGVIDTGAGYPFLQPNPSVLNFGFFDSFDDLFRRFRARLWPVSVLGRGGEDSDESSGAGGFGISPPFDSSKGNTTSTVKVVDGHKVEVNETVYGDEHSVFKVRVVNVRPLEEGESVEETVRTSSGSGSSNDDSQNTNAPKPVTSRPEAKGNSAEDEEEGRREPLEKKPTENEIQGNIDDPEHLTNTENIVEATTKTIDDDNNKEEDDEDKMLPTATEDLEFVTDNGSDAVERVEEELNENGNGNNEFETNMSAVGQREGENSADIATNDDAVVDDNDDDADDEGDDAIANVEIENNEDTEEVNDNLNESSSTSDVQGIAAFNGGNGEFDDVENVEEFEADLKAEEVNSNVRHSNYAVIRNKQREDASSSDDEDADDREVPQMHPTFNDEWGTHNENKENNDFSNDIDVYDVEPVDLSNDIAVNDAANLPLNPDAEFIDILGSKQTLHTMPKFEKLSLGAVPINGEDLSSSSLSGGDMK